MLKNQKKPFQINSFSRFFSIVAVSLFFLAATLPQAHAAPPIGAMVEDLLAQEEETPTSSSNVQERLHRLTNIMRMVGMSGFQNETRRILPRSKAQELERMIQRGDRGKAAEEVREAIGKLEDLPVEEISESAMSRPGQGQGRFGRGGPQRGFRQGGGRSGGFGGRESGGFGQDRGQGGGRPGGGRPDLDAGEPIDGLPKLEAFAEVDFHRMVMKGGDFGNILKLFNPVIDPDRRKLYVVGSKTTHVAVIDLDTDELEKTFDPGVMGGFLVFKNKKLYSFDYKKRKLYKIDPDREKATEIQFSKARSLVPRDKGKSKSWGEYEFKMGGFQSFDDGTAGFPTDWRQDMNAAYGLIKITDRRGRKKGEINIGPDALYFIIDDETGKLYSTATGHGSVRVFDLNRLKETDYCRNNRCLVKEIDIGTSADQVIADSKGNIYLRNRLGGSVIYKKPEGSDLLTVIPNENLSSHGIAMWPTYMLLSRSEKYLYVLGHYGAVIDVVSTRTSRRVGRIEFDTSWKPRTDSISAMVMDEKHRRIYAAWPELGVVAVGDTKTYQQVKLINLSQYGYQKSKGANRGPGLINLAVNESTGELYVHLHEKGRLLRLDGKNYHLKKEIDISSKKKIETNLHVNSDTGDVYFGNQVLDGKTLRTKDTLPGERVAAIDTQRGAVLSTRVVPNRGFNGSQEALYRTTNGKRDGAWLMEEIGGIRSRFYLDVKKNWLYVSYFEDGVVKIYDMNDQDGSGSGSSGGKSDKFGWIHDEQ
ncbi:MAG: hypothetical protein HQL52_15290 [Magnetococcales bacterium]|nr:hypothetical protein [Magnetococcales bacterium]